MPTPQEYREFLADQSLIPDGNTSNLRSDVSNQISASIRALCSELGYPKGYRPASTSLTPLIQDYISEREGYENCVVNRLIEALLLISSDPRKSIHLQQLLEQFGLEVEES